MSAWGKSWGKSWGSSWGSIGVEFLSLDYYGKLGELGFSGTIDDRQKAYLVSLGYTGQMNDCMRLHLRNLGYSDEVQTMLVEKSKVEGFSSVSEMWVKYGLIPLE